MFHDAAVDIRSFRLFPIGDCNAILPTWPFNRSSIGLDSFAKPANSHGRRTRLFAIDSVGSTMCIESVDLTSTV